MKKLLAILLAMVMVLSLFAGCSEKKSSKKKNDKDSSKKDKESTSQTSDSTDGTGSTKGNEATGETTGNGETIELTQWEKAILPENFKNVTVKLEATFLGDDVTKQPDDSIYAINGNMISVGSENDFSESAELIETVNAAMINPVRDLIANKGSVYVTDEGVFTINASECTVNFSVYQAKISATDIVFTLDEDGHLATFECTMVQDITSETEGNIQLQVEATFTFSNYGTTGVSK